MSSGRSNGIYDESNEYVGENSSSSIGLSAYCKCGVRAPTWTSWTSNNPGRRFVGCPNYESNMYCRYFHWIDDELHDARYKKLIMSMRNDYQSMSLRLMKFKEEMREKYKEMKNMDEQLGKMRLKNLKLKTKIDQSGNNKMWGACLILMAVNIVILVCIGLKGILKTGPSNYLAP